MTYDIPTVSDYVNVRALNREFLRLARTSPAYIDFDSVQRHSLLALGAKQRENLAATPFLLFSLHDYDTATWQQLLSGERANDMFRNLSTTPAEISNLLTATIAFLWQLAQRNPYAARLISGAEAQWCERISAVTSFDLVSRVNQRADLLTIRRTASTDIWAKLLDPGVSPKHPIRSAAHMAVLQALLATPSAALTTAWPLAACKTQRPHLQVADDTSKN